MKVRRSSDNATQDIGFVGGVLDTASLLTFVGANNGFVTTWYDQSGNGNHATQATTANQPQIVVSGAVVLRNTKPAVLWNSTNQTTLNLTTPLPVTLPQSFHAVAEDSRVAVYRYILGGTGGSTTFSLGFANNGTAAFFNVFGGPTLANPPSVAGLNNLIWAQGASAGSAIVNNSTTVTGNPGAITQSVNCLGQSVGGWIDSGIPEVMMWSSTLLGTPDISTLYTNQKAYFGTP